jgi:HAMP domain-containing protein
MPRLRITVAIGLVTAAGLSVDLWALIIRALRPLVGG